MQAKPFETAVTLQLPIMCVAPNRTLTYVYVQADDLGKLDQIRSAAEADGIVLQLQYAFRQPGQSRITGALVLDATAAKMDVRQTVEKLGRLPGVEIVQSGEPEDGLVASESHQLQVVGMPVVVVGRDFISATYRHLVEALGEQVEAVLHTAGMEAGRQAARDVPALLTQLGVPSSVDLIRRRFRDLQVFGWAEIVSLRADDDFVGEALLANDFEAVAWQGQAGTPRCHWIRGFIRGALSSLEERPFSVLETECQAKGDPYCRMVFGPSAP